MNWPRLRSPSRSDHLHRPGCTQPSSRATRGPGGRRSPRDRGSRNEDASRAAILARQFGRSWDASPMRCRHALAVCGAALVGGCSAPAPGAHTRTDDPIPTTAPSVAPGAALGCNAIGDNLPTKDRVIVLDNVALPAQRTAPALHTARQPDPSHRLLTYFAKNGLGFRIGSQWRLRVPKGAQDHLRIGWGSPATPRTVVRPPAGCPTTSKTGWV